jgi:hypothetical protein
MPKLPQQLVPSPWLLVTSGIQFAVYILVPLLVFGLGGKYAAERYHMPWLIIVGLALSISTSSLIIARAINRLRDTYYPPT